MNVGKGQHRRLLLIACAALIVLGVAVILARNAIAAKQVAFGDPFPTLTAPELGLFATGKEDFEEEEDAAAGLGPVFNNVSCAACHSNPAVGGDSDILETRFGTITHGRFDPMEEKGGSLIQSQGIPCIDEEGKGEKVPKDATRVAQRKTTPLFGLGLVDAVSDDSLEQIAAAQKRSAPHIAGEVHWVRDVASGKVRAGRFGWKSQVATLMTFSGDAYLNEMGITTPMFPNENPPGGDASQLAKCDTVADPEDDGTAVENFANFMSSLAPPPRGRITSDVDAGERLFERLGCATCHLPTMTTGRHRTAALDRVTFHPFSDFLLHDMGDLGDGIEQGRANGREMRTAPLWGLSVRNTFLHDGRATTLEAAILGHDGQGDDARQRYKHLSPDESAKLIAFLKSL